MTLRSTREQRADLAGFDRIGDRDRIRQQQPDQRAGENRRDARRYRPKD